MDWSLIVILLIAGLISGLALSRYHHKPKRSGMMMHDLKEGSVKPVEETAAGKLFDIIRRPQCPDCGSTKGWYQGPSGGLSTNIFCANRECRAGFNITPVIGIAERIHKADIERYPK